ncbi:uncharacterized protein LOC143252502 isoform X1 [Tachypleus tridentatus]
MILLPFIYIKKNLQIFIGISKLDSQKESKNLKNSVPDPGHSMGSTETDLIHLNIDSKIPRCIQLTQLFIVSKKKRLRRISGK